MTTSKTETDANRDAALKQSYVIATKQLREAHLEEFNALRQAAADDLGVEWNPRKTKEQKAEEDLARLIEQYPHLAEKIKNEGVGAVI